MKTRRLGKTNLQVSEIGFGGEWLERHPEEEGIALIEYASAQGINILDCWMADPKSRNIIGKGIHKNRDTYCGHCKPCVANLDIAMINKFYDLATMQPEVPATVQSHYELLEKTASACIDCHACESRCPFGVKIAERMKKAAELFGC